MSNMVVFDFDGIHTADEVLNKLRALQKEYLIDLEDACVVERDQGAKVHIKQAVNLTAMGAAAGGMRGALFGTLIGILFLKPLAGMALGAMAGAGAGALSGSRRSLDDRQHRAFPISVRAMDPLVGGVRHFHY